MGDKDRRIVRTTTWSAGPGCHGGCGVLAHIEDGKLIKIEGNAKWILQQKIENLFPGDYEIFE